MQLKIKGKVIYSYSVKRLVYALCFAMFCLIDQRIKTCTGLDGWLESFRDLTGVVMAVIIMSHYKFDDFKKWKFPYSVWSVVCIIGGIIAIWWGKNNYYFFNDWIVKVIDVILFGYILIHTFINVVFEKKYPKLNKKFAIVWLAMMVLMIVSRSNYIWPFCYLVMFGCFYLTDYTKEEQEELLQGMLDGVILAFFLMQGWCFVFRPYDEWRYTGVYSNSNMNALFYVEVLVAALIKAMICMKAKNKWLEWYYKLGIGVVLVFLFFTAGRAAWLTSFVLIVLWLVELKRRKVQIYKNLIAITVSFVLLFPLVFGATRYLPPVFHHPVWFWGEWSTDKVHSWDPYDSYKYTDIDELMNSSLGRIVDSIKNVIDHSPLVLKVHAAEVVESVPNKKIPVLTSEEGRDDFLVRTTIYKHYFERLNLFGYPYDEQGFQLLENYWIGHAHNIYLQYGTDFGVIVMVLFVSLIAIPVMELLRTEDELEREQKLCNAMYILIPGFFGMFEYSWGVGSLSIAMLFIAWRKVIANEKGN